MAQQTRETKTALPGPEEELYQLLFFNLHRLASNKRQAIITKVLAADGGLQTINATIKLIDIRRSDFEKHIADIRKNEKADQRKHPCLSFFGLREHHNQAIGRVHENIIHLNVIQNELIIATKLHNVIEQSRFNKLPPI